MQAQPDKALKAKARKTLVQDLNFFVGHLKDGIYYNSNGGTTQQVIDSLLALPKFPPKDTIATMLNNFKRVYKWLKDFSRAEELGKANSNSRAAEIRKEFRSNFYAGQHFPPHASYTYFVTLALDWYEANVNNGKPLEEGDLRKGLISHIRAVLKQQDFTADPKLTREENSKALVKHLQERIADVFITHHFMDEKFSYKKNAGELERELGDEIWAAYRETYPKLNEVATNLKEGLASALNFISPAKTTRSASPVSGSPSPSTPVVSANPRSGGLIFSPPPTLQAIEGRLAENQLALEKIEQDLAGFVQNISEHEKILEGFKVEIPAVAHQKDTLQNDIQALRGEIDRLEKDALVKKERAKQLNRDKKDLGSRYRKSAQEIKAREEELLELQAAAKEVENIQAKIAADESRKERLILEMTELDAKIGTQFTEIRRIIQEISIVQGKLSRQKDSMAASRVKFDNKEFSLEEARSELQKKKEQIELITARQNEYAAAMAHYQEKPEHEKSEEIMQIMAAFKRVLEQRMDALAAVLQVDKATIQTIANEFHREMDPDAPRNDSSVDDTASEESGIELARIDTAELNDKAKPRVRDIENQMLERDSVNAAENAKEMLSSKLAKKWWDSAWVSWIPFLVRICEWANGLESFEERKDEAKRFLNSVAVLRKLEFLEDEQFTYAAANKALGEGFKDTDEHGITRNNPVIVEKLEKSSLFFIEKHEKNKQVDDRALRLLQEDHDRFETTLGMFENKMRQDQAVIEETETENKRLALQEKSVESEIDRLQKAKENLLESLTLEFESDQAVAAEQEREQKLEELLAKKRRLELAARQLEALREAHNGLEAPTKFDEETAQIKLSRESIASSLDEKRKLVKDKEEWLPLVEKKLEELTAEQGLIFQQLRVANERFAALENEKGRLKLEKTTLERAKESAAKREAEEARLKEEAEARAAADRAARPAPPAESPPPPSPASRSPFKIGFSVFGTK